ncbi:hypothetical protein FOZ61_008109 [Perkinsus olseni]|uniref:Uncharacterized protein n=1 Tax=Perkinsus olseni TaxID=32597 RepID=A0A7J6MT68_PEROL|nr:hypothetical protein FOZ61_008109 [Perkinsus olseni]KAF4674782.1 hypothetical protein FOL46_004041 [Perkinsus olseni]
MATVRSLTASSLSWLHYTLLSSYRIVRDTDGPHIAALRMLLLEHRANAALPECLEDLIWAYLLPITINSPDTCVQNTFRLPARFKPIALSFISEPTDGIFGVWEEDTNKVARMALGTGSTSGQALGNTGEVVFDAGSEVTAAVSSHKDVYYVTSASPRVLHRRGLLESGEYELISSLSMPRSIRELKLASGRIFLLLEGGSELYRLTYYPSMNIEMVGKLPLGGKPSPVPRSGLVRMTIESSLGVWRPDDFVFKAVQVPRFCCCRFVLRTNGNVVAGVFGGSWGHSFSVYEIFENKVSTCAFAARESRVISVAVSSDRRVSVSLWKEKEGQSCGTVVRTVTLSRSGARTYDHGFIYRPRSIDTDRSLAYYYAAAAQDHVCHDDTSDDSDLDEVIYGNIFDDSGPDEVVYDDIFVDSGPDEVVYDDIFVDSGPDEVVYDDIFLDAGPDEVVYVDIFVDSGPDEVVYDDIFSDAGPDEVVYDDIFVDSGSDY